MRSEQEMATGQYMEYQSPFAPASPPDSFYAQVNVQPPTSDSNVTPPSPTYSRTRRTVARPSQGHHVPSTGQSSASYSAHRTSKSTREPPSRFRKERERQLANTPREALIQLVVLKEHEYTEAKHLLTTAILQVESLKDRLVREEKARKALEEENRSMGLKTTKAILDSQKEAIKTKEDIGFYKLQHENIERQLRHANERLRAAEKERDEADRALVRARSTARQLKEDNVVLKAREEGRQEGFEEGLRQGRLQQASLTPEEGSETKPRKKERKTPAPPPPPPPPPGPTPEQEAALAALREIDEREKLRIRLQLSDVERKLDAERQKTKDLERYLKKSTSEKSRAEQDRLRYEQERDQARMALEGIEREKEELKRRETEALQRASSERRRLTEENERERREIFREKERAEKEKRELQEKAREEVERERERAKKAEEDRERDREREREREKEREREQREKDRETSATIAAATAAAVSAVVGAATSSHNSSPEPTQPQVHDYRSQPYIPMPAPPAGVSIPIDMPTPVVMPAPDIPSADNIGVYPTIPRAGSSGSQRGYYKPRRDSFTSATSTQFDLLQLPVERGLSAIPEDASVRANSPAPTWGSQAWYDKYPSHSILQDIGISRGPSGEGPSFPTAEIPNIIPKGVASGGVSFPVPEVPNIVSGGPAGTPVEFPQAHIPNIVPKGGIPGPGGVSFPTPEVPNIVPGRGPTPGVGSEFPQPEIPNIIPKGGYGPGGSGIEFPKAEIPNIVSRGGEPFSGGNGTAFPEPQVPNIIPKGGSAGYTPGGGISFPSAEVPNIIPKGTPGGYTPGGGIAFPSPSVPDIVGRTGSSSTGPTVAFPTPEVPNIIPKGGASFPTPQIPNIIGKGDPGGGNMFPTPEIPNIVGRAESSLGRHTPASGGISFPAAEIPNIVGRASPSPGNGAGLFPIPEVPNIIPKGATSGGVSFPTAEIPQIIPKVASSGSGGFPTPHIPNIIPKGQIGGGVQFPTAEIPDIVPKGGLSQPTAAFPTPVIPNIVPKGKKGKKGSLRSETPRVLSEESASISRVVEFPTAEIPNIVPPKGVSSAFGSSPSWPAASLPTNTGGAPGWPAPTIPGNKPGPSSPYSNPTHLKVSNPGLLRRPSIGSTGSYDVMVHIPSRPESRSSPTAEQNRLWLSPNHSSIPLPKQPRGGNVSTQPNTPVVITGALPAGFIPQSITDANGISTPIYAPNALPPMGPPVIPSSSGGDFYKNPVNRDRDDRPPSVFGGAAPGFPHSPAMSIKPLGTPSAVWGNMGGMTPGSTTRDLPGGPGRGSLFGGASPMVAPIAMPEPTIPNFEDENEDAIDRNTSINTKLNAGMGGGSAAKKKKKKR